MLLACVRMYDSCGDYQMSSLAMHDSFVLKEYRAFTGVRIVDLKKDVGVPMGGQVTEHFISRDIPAGIYIVALAKSLQFLFEVRKSIPILAFGLCPFGGDGKRLFLGIKASEVFRIAVF